MDKSVTVINTATSDTFTIYVSSTATESEIATIINDKYGDGMEFDID